MTLLIAAYIYWPSIVAALWGLAALLIGLAIITASEEKVETRQ